MGKKQIDKMMMLKDKFLEGGQANGHPKDKLEKIWADWEKFASYAFNKSHAACYSWVAYQTAYLKAHYPAEYMAAVLTSEQSDNKRVTELMEDCRKNGIEIMLPSVNESMANFAANHKGQIRFGLQGIVGMGEAAASAIIEEREQHGPYADIFDFLSRVNLRTVGRKNVEVLIKAGAFDGVGEMHRAQYFVPDSAAPDSPVFLDRLFRWAMRQQEAKDSSQMNLFDLSVDMRSEANPVPPQCAPWSTIEQCNKEKEVVGFYISAHPLDDFRYEMKHFAMSTSQLADLDKLAGQNVRFGGIITSARNGISKKGKPYGIMTIEDYDGSYELRLFDDQLQQFKAYFTSGLFVFCKGSVQQWTTVNPDGSVSKSSPRLKISDIFLLSSVLEKYAKCIKIQMPVEALSERFIDLFKRTAAKHKGSVPVRVILSLSFVSNGQPTMRSLEFSSSSAMVNPREFLLDMRSQMPDLQMSVAAKPMF